MIIIDEFIEGYSSIFKLQTSDQPWIITTNIKRILEELILSLDYNFDITNGIAVHKSSSLENGAILKPPVIIGENCFIGANAYLRGGVYLGNSSRIGPGCEIKSSIIFTNTNIAHFNFIGDSIIGNNVNFEAGSVTANHYNERDDKNIFVLFNNTIINTCTNKFGSLIGDNSKIGSNAVLSPGSILNKNTIVQRLELIDQLKNT